MEIKNVQLRSQTINDSVNSVKNAPKDINQPLNTDTVALNTVADLPGSFFQLAKNYDVTSMTESEVASLSKSLKEMGAISADVYAVMSFPRREASTREGADINLDEKFDFLDSSRKTLEFLKSANAYPQTIEIQQKIVDILAKLNAVS